MRSALIASLALGVLAGCDREDESVAKQAGDKVGEVVTDFARGVGQGVNKGMEVNVELSDALTARGVEKTIAKHVGVELREKAIAVYLIANQPLKTRLMAKALNEAGQEIGRAVADVELGADDAKYVTFTFDPEMDTQLVDKYFIDLKEGPIRNDTPKQEPDPPADEAE